MNLKNSLYLNNFCSCFRKERLIFQFLFFLFSLGASSQQIANYINNGSFEVTYNCNWPYGVEKAKYWRSIDSLSYGGGYFSICNGVVPYDGVRYQWPRSYNSFIACGYYCPPPNCSVNSNRGYQRNRLKATLQSGKTYCVKFYINICNPSSMGIDAFGAYFGDNTLDTITKGAIPLTYLIPQIQNPLNNFITDTLGWVAITGTFVANGTEKHCVIGNFKSDATTNTILINPPSLPSVFTDIGLDDVSCIPLDLPAYAAAGNDIWAIPGNTIYLGRPQDVGIDEACEWFKLPNTTSVIANAAGLTLTVAITTNTYMVKQTICGIVNYDTVVVHASGVGLSEQAIIKNSVNVFPNPATDNLNITLNFDLEKEFTKIEILNSLGQLIREEEIVFKNKNAAIKTSDLPNGVYLLNLRGDNSFSVVKRFTVAR
jgi:hypothetical protein